MTFIHLKSFTYDKIMLEEILSLPKKKSMGIIALQCYISFQKDVCMCIKYSNIYNIAIYILRHYL